MTYTPYDVWSWPKASAKDPGRSVHSAPHEHTQHPTYERGQKLVPKTLEGQCTVPPTNIHNMHMPMHFQHQSTFHFHVILNINIISSQWRYQQQQQPHFIFTYSSIITIHVDMVFINNIISNQYHHNYHYHHISIKILNSNINNNSNKHNNIISTRTVFKQHISNNQNNIIHHNTYIYRIPLVKT